MNAMTGNTKRDLSARESQILELAAKGVTDKEIAANCGISTGTVHTHWNRIYPKLGVANRAEAVSVYVEKRSHQKIADMAARLETVTGEMDRQSASTRMLRENHDLLESIIGGAPCVLWAVDRDGKLLLLDGVDIERLGLRSCPENGDTAARFLQTVMTPTEWAAVLAGERVASVRKFGQLWLKTRISPAAGAAGRMDTVVGLSTDLAGWMPAQSEFELNIELIQSLIDCFPMAALVMDVERPDSIVANAVASKMLGFRPDEADEALLNHSLSFIHPDDRARAASQLQAARTTGTQEIAANKVRLRTRDDRCVATTVRWSPVGPPERAPHRYVVGIFQERTGQAWDENDCLTCTILADCRAPHFEAR